MDYETWLSRHYPHLQTDWAIRPFLPLKADGPWLKRSRRALFLSTREVARRLRVHQSSYSRLELSEESGTITLRKLRAAAEAMDCELIYAIRPKSRMSFGQIIWAKIPKSGPLTMYIPRLRRRNGWARNDEPAARAVAACTRDQGLPDPEFQRQLFRLVAQLRKKKSV